MTPTVPLSPTTPQTQTWEQIEQVVASFAEIAQSEISLAEFANAWLQNLLKVLPASGGAVWLTQGADTPPQALAISGLSDDLLACADMRFASVASASVDIRKLRVGQVEVLQGVVGGGEQSLAVEVWLAPGLMPSELAGAERLVKVFAEIAAEYQQRRELQALRVGAARQRQFQQFLLRIHDSLNPLQTAYAIANDGRTWLGCDRVSVVQCRDARTTVLAISGVDTVDQRAEEVRRLADLATLVARVNEPLYWSGMSDEQLPPQLADALQAYLDRSHAQHLAVMPLRASDSGKATQAVLIVEWLDQRIDAATVRRLVGEVARHSEVALNRAWEHNLPLLSAFVALGRAQAWLQRRLNWFAALLVAVVTIVCALFFIQVDFALEARGTLQPRERRNLFAPADGVVEQIEVEHGDKVTRGQELMLLRDAQLEFEFSRASGDLQTTLARLATVSAQRSIRPTGERPRDDQRDLAAEEEQLKQKVAGLQSQLRVLETMRDDLRIVSPLAGQVLTWHAQELLASRPVKRGQLLLTIADPQGPWELELRVPDADVGHVLQAQQQRADDLPVTFLLATDPSQTRHGTIERVALNSEVVDGQTPSALVNVRLADVALPESRAGATVIARIHCGQRSIGYVWLHELIDAVRTRVLF